MPDKRSSDGYDIQMQANQLSHYLLTKLCMESLESAAAARGEARIVYHSSSARNGLPSDLDPKFFQICDAGSLGGDDKMTAPWERWSVVMVRTVVPGPAPSLITVMWDWIEMQFTFDVCCVRK